MTWTEIRVLYPNTWVMVEARAWTTRTQKHLLLLTVVAHAPDPGTILRQAFQSVQRYPQRDLYLAHTSSPTLQMRSAP